MSYEAFQCSINALIARIGGDIGVSFCNDEDAGRFFAKCSDGTTIIGRPSGKKSDGSVWLRAPDDGGDLMAITSSSVLCAIYALSVAVAFCVLLVVFGAVFEMLYKHVSSFRCRIDAILDDVNEWT